MFAIIRTRWQPRPLSCRARRRSSAAPGSLRKKYAGIVYPPNMVRLPNHSTTSGNPRKPVLYYTDLLKFLDASVSFYLGHGSIAGTSYGSGGAGAQATAQGHRPAAGLPPYPGQAVLLANASLVQPAQLYPMQQPVGARQAAIHGKRRP